MADQRNSAGAVFVTGATGTVGSAVVEHLLLRGERVVAGVRDAQGERIGDGSDAPGLPQAVERRAFAFGTDPAALDRVLEGCDRLFLMRPPPIADVQTRLFPLIDAAARARMRQIVFLLLQGVTHNRATPHYAVEQYLRQSGVSFTFLRPNFFMQNLSATYRDDIRERDEIYLPAGRALTAFIDARDIGAVAAAVFTSSGHDGRAYTLSGEQTLGYARVARILTSVLGRRIRYLRPSERDYLDRLAEQGAPADYIAVQKMIYRVVRLNVSALPNRSVRRLTGRPATAFRAFAERERHAWER